VAEQELPPPAEQVHMPEPSYLPVVTGFGITLMLVGVVLTWFLTIMGAVIFLVAVVRWIRDARADIAELPLEH
jgi:type IV secretory pathway TrbD component